MAESDRELRALVVAADSALRRTVARALTENGMQVTTAEEPYEALSRFVRSPARLVVLSLEGLRRRDRAVLHELHRFSPDLRALILVPDGRRGDVSVFLAAGADAVLPEPVSVEELKLIVRSLLRSDAADLLTGLPNRGAYERAISREIARAERDGRTLGLGLIDLDRFKSVNTKHGYRGGDRVLRATAGRLREAFRMTDVVARWGGEEFAVLLTGLPEDEMEARSLAREALDRARRSVRAKRMTVQGEGEMLKLRVSVSAGLALFPHDAATREDLFDIANTRLARGKRAGRDRVVADDEPMLPPDAERERLED